MSIENVVPPVVIVPLLVRLYALMLELTFFKTTEGLSPRGITVFAAIVKV